MKFLLIPLLLACTLARAEPGPELINTLKASVVKVHTVTKSGGHGVGTGVVVSQDHIATSCHVLANASGITIRKMGENHAPVAMKTDWKHDICLLRFQGLPLSPVALGSDETLAYEQPVFSIGFPGGVPRPQVTTGLIKALYPLDDSVIIRSSASFRMGASGSPLLDEQGRLVGINTFKSPGRDAFFYNIPVKWVKALLAAPETVSIQQEDLPFWDAPEEVRPYFMRVVPPLLSESWPALKQVAQSWAQAEPGTVEAWYHLAYAESQLRENEAAQAHFRQALSLNAQHAPSLFELAVLASRQGEREDYEKWRLALLDIAPDSAEDLAEAATALR